MKTLMIIFATLMAFNAQAANSSDVQEVEVPVDHLYVPKGFDSNDKVELFLEGYLPNLCYKNPSAKVQVEGKEIKVKVIANSTEGVQEFCAEMIVPFNLTFSVGLLDQGHYDIKVNNKLDSSIYVKESTSDAIDDYLYANVERVEQIKGKNRVLIRGHHPSYCVEFERFKITDNGSDVYSVQPLTNQISDFCPMKMIPFEYEVNMPNNLERKRLLIHVRSMNGNAVNSIFIKK